MAAFLAGQMGLDEVSAIKRFITDLTGNITVIALTRRSGVLTHVWVTDDPADTLADCKRYGWPDETVEFRLWDGTPKP